MEVQPGAPGRTAVAIQDVERYDGRDMPAATRVLHVPSLAVSPTALPAALRAEDVYAAVGTNTGEEVVGQALLESLDAGLR